MLGAGVGWAEDFHDVALGRPAASSSMGSAR